MTVRLLHYSDLEDVFDDPAHAARLATVITRRRDEQTLVLGSGDDTAPSVLGVTTGGRHALDFFNAVETNFETFGNHDFDHGLDTTRKLVRDAPNRWLTANVFEADGTRFGAPHTVPWIVVDVAGTQVGLVGVTTADTTTTNPRAESLTVTDPVVAATEGVTELRKVGADLVVVLAHVGDETLADAVDADVVLDGHRHDAVTSTHGETCYVRTESGGASVTEVTLSSDSSPTVRRHDVSADVEPDTRLETALRERIAATGLDETVAHVDPPIERDEAAVNCAESALGNFVTDAIRWATDADVAVLPAGGIRPGPPLAGDVTVFDLHRLAPFDDEFQVVDCRGDELRAVVRDLSLTDRSTERIPAACFGHVSGMTVVWDDERGELRDLLVDGRPVDDGERYRLATVGYFLQTDRRLRTVDSTDVVTTYHGQNPLVAYARRVGIDPVVDGRLQRPTLE